MSVKIVRTGQETQHDLHFACFAAHPGSTVTYVLLWRYGAIPCDRGGRLTTETLRKKEKKEKIL